jgi:CubicO group peptidase (beta-lactamase class C family)
MKRIERRTSWNRIAIAAHMLVLLPGCDKLSRANESPRRHTDVTIRGDAFVINGRPTYEGRAWKDKKIEGLLFNSRMVQGIFDDLNPDTVSKWAYPDTQKWDPERNSRAFIAAMPDWRKHGLLAFTINLQGGSPTGYSKDQPWHNSAITDDGELRPDYMARLERILNRADELGMVAILGIFYFGQDQRLKDENAVHRAVDGTVDWINTRGFRNVLIEINNECNVRYDHAILQPPRVHELIERAKVRSMAGSNFKPHRLLVGTSYGGGTIPQPNVVKASDFLLLHGNGISDPQRIAEMVRKTRQVEGYRPMPILFNEDDHFDFDKPANNFIAAVNEYASWGYFDYRMKDEGFDEGYQSVPVNWGISSARKRGFFTLLREITAEPAEVSRATGSSLPVPGVSDTRADEPTVAPRAVFPGATWDVRTPAELGLDAAKLDALRDLVGGRGCVVWHGQLAYTWGDVKKSADVASAAKPVISTLLMRAVAEGRLKSVDDRVADVEPRLRDLNGGKDSAITWRHLASQMSGYGLTERPGEAYGYNDFALALYYQTLTSKVFRATGTDVLKTRIAEPLQFEDEHKFDALGPDRPGRLALSVRDFARFGLLCLHEGDWNGRQVIPREMHRLAIANPIPAATLLTAGRDADMLPGQKSMGGGKNITKCGPGFYSFNWWLNGLDREGRRLHVVLPPTAYLAAGHGGQKMLWLIPSLDMIVCWHTPDVNDHDASPGRDDTKCARAAKLIAESVR